MSQVRERSTYLGRPLPDEAMLDEQGSGRTSAILRTVGAIAVLVIGAIHLQQYVAVGFSSVAVIGPLFLLNFAGATLIGLGLLAPVARLRRIHGLLAVGGIGLAVTSFVFLLISEHQPLFGFQEHGYRAAIVIALAAEAVAFLTLVAYLATGARRRT